MNTNAPYPPPAFTIADIVKGVRLNVDARGLKRTIEDFEGMERLLSANSWWCQIKEEVELIFAEARKQEEQRKLERIKAGAPNIYQFMPTAQNGVSLNAPQFAGAMYEVKGNDNVNIGKNE